MGVIETVCDRVLVMADGRVVTDDGVDTLLRGAADGAVVIESPDLDAGAVAGLRDRFEVTAVEEGPAGGRVEVAAAGDELYDLMDALAAADVTPERVRTVEPDLEDVFVGLTREGER